MKEKHSLILYTSPQKEKSERDRERARQRERERRERETETETDRQRERERRGWEKDGELVTWCFKPSKPQRIKSGLRETFIEIHS